MFNVSATGNLPLAYQWLFNSTHIPNATNSTLTITNASAGNAGLYSVVVTNAFRSQTSPTAALMVVCPTVIYGQLFIALEWFRLRFGTFQPADSGHDSSRRKGCTWNLRT